MRQETVQHDTTHSRRGLIGSRAEPAGFSAYVAAMAIVVGLIIAWVSVCAI